MVTKKLIFKKLEEAVKNGLIEESLVESLNFHKDAVGIDGNKLFIVKDYAKWLFGETKHLKIIEIDLDEKSVRMLERYSNHV